MWLNTRTIEGNKTSEIYVTAAPTPGTDVQEQAAELFVGISDFLDSKCARILQERVFATKQAIQIIRPIRAKAYGRFNDEVEPAWLVVPEGVNGQIAGVQMHAIVGEQNLEILYSEGTACGRIIRWNKGGYLTLSSVSVHKAGGTTQQARAMFEKAETVLRQAGIDMLSVPRTWIWLDDILSWYDDFNAERNNYFIERGLVGKGTMNKMPASTGIGIDTDNSAMCAMDLAALIGPDSSVEYLDAGGNQQSAFDYGSAFSRASRATTPAGTTVFVSGTASIAKDGTTMHVGDAEAQIEASISNVQAVLREMGYADNDVVQGTAYCKTTEVEKLFRDKWSGLPWPNITAIADVCREDLLFEIEAIAVVADY
jgi:enamine deaminase RidA (YjgF/YER057c/UK114 family)